MPKRTDIRKICIIGAGPIIIGQACEFDYSGTQACKALREEGYEVVLINSNPATIMTDPETAPHTYVEPVTPEALAAVLRKERPDALLPTLGGQTALNTAFKVAETGLLEELGIEMIGATAEVIHRAEDRDAFRETMRTAGIDLPHSGLARTIEEAREVVKEVGLPCIIRPAFTLGGTGGGMAYNMEEFERVAAGGLHASLVNEILVEEDLTGWKEFEVEVMRDRKDNVVIVCSIENFDPMGVHTGDAITVAPIQTMTDREYQKLRDDSITIIRAIGVETGGCNIQFAQCPRTGRMVVIEMNPRVSRSSALASKATGFPIAKIAAKVAVGYTLDEIPNDITRETPACFEPSIDYCVVKIPRFTFEKFPGSDDTLTIQMKSVGEVMAIGRTFKEALQKGLRSMENGRSGLGADGKDLPADTLDPDRIREYLARPNRDRLYWIRHAFKAGMTIADIHDITMIDPWFLDNVLEIVETEEELAQALLLRREQMAHDPHNAPGHEIPDWLKQRMTEEAARPEGVRRPEGTGLWLLTDDEIRLAKGMGFSDVQLAHMAHASETSVREERIRRGIEAVYKLVDTCGAEFEAATPYYYSTYEEEDETRPGTKEKVMILGGGPNRIGQGIEFDYCCCHASFASKDLGYESIMMNCNPETVSTDYDTSDRLYFDPLTVEDVLSVVRREKPKGLIVQFGGQTPLNIARRLSEAGVPILGTGVDSIDRAEDREQFSAMLDKLGLQQTPNATTLDIEDAIEKAEAIGYPVLMRPSFVLGGAKMEIVYTPAHLRTYWGELIQYCQKADVQISRERPILIDKFLEDATEVDTDALCDGTDVYIAGIMEHIEEAGIHSGDSACSLPPYSLSTGVIRKIEEATVKLALELGVCGLMNVQYAIKDEELYVLEVNPRASRTVPFVSKVTGVPVARLATMVMLGKTISELGLRERPVLRHVGVKESVFPWSRFPGVDAVLGPEMKSTGEVMGIDTNFPMAFAKSQIGAGTKVPLAGTAFLSVKESDRRWLGTIARKLHGLGFHLVATAGSAQAIRKEEIPVEVLNKVSDRKHPNVIDYMIDGRVHLVINTPSGKTPRKDEILIRTTAVNRNVPLVTTMAAARAFIEAIGTMKERSKSGETEAFSVRSLQSYHAADAK